MIETLWLLVTLNFLAVEKMNPSLSSFSSSSSSSSSTTTTELTRFDLVVQVNADVAVLVEVEVGILAEEKETVVGGQELVEEGKETVIE
jgi:hypothetical protein